MTVYVIILTTVDDTETHHREIVPKIMRAMERHGGKAHRPGPRRAAQGPRRRAAQRQSPGRSRVSQPRGRRGLGRGCQGQSRAAPHPRRPDAHQRAGDLINLGLVKIVRQTKVVPDTVDLVTQFARQHSCPASSDIVLRYVPYWDLGHAGKLSRTILVDEGAFSTADCSSAQQWGRLMGAFSLSSGVAGVAPACALVGAVT